MTSNLVQREGFWVRADNVEQDLTIVRDVFQNDCYRLALVRERFPRRALVLDVGAHIGCFARLAHELLQEPEIICVEACPENIDCLRANVEDFARVVQAACTYERRELALYNAVRPHCQSTGGTTVVVRHAPQPDEAAYWLDERPLPRVSLEDLAFPWVVDLLKLDCEGSEFSILANTRMLERIGFIVGEYHGRAAWEYLRAWRFADWDYGHMSQAGELGNFHLRNPNWPPRAILDPRGEAVTCSDSIDRAHRLEGEHRGPPPPHFPPREG